ncbi:UNVERIFIED_CONTAM: hypothetical protein FKN15_048353 [Acipenser sinensis]
MLDFIALTQFSENPNQDHDCDYSTNDIDNQVSFILCGVVRGIVFLGRGLAGHKPNRGIVVGAGALIQPALPELAAESKATGPAAIQTQFSENPNQDHDCDYSTNDIDNQVSFILCGVVRGIVFLGRGLAGHKPNRGIVVGAEEQGEWKGPFYFIQAAEPQLGLIKAWAVGDCEKGGDERGQEVTLTQQAVQAVNKLAPRSKFMVFCRDIQVQISIAQYANSHGITYFVHKVQSGTQWQDEQERDMKVALRGMDPAIPLVFVSGNHNIGNMPTLGTITQCRRSWGEDYFSFRLSRCNDLNRSQISIFQAQIDSLPKRFQCEISLAVQQLKLLLGTLMKSSAQEGVKAVFSGHYHCNAGGMHNGPDMVVTSATGCQLGTDPHGLRVVVVTEVIHRYYSLDELSKIGMEKELRDLAFQHQRRSSHETLETMGMVSFPPFVSIKSFSGWIRSKEK